MSMSMKMEINGSNNNRGNFFIRSYRRIQLRAVASSDRSKTESSNGNKVDKKKDGRGNSSGGLNKDKKKDTTVKDITDENSPPLVLTNRTNNFNISNTADTAATLISMDQNPPLADAVTISPAILPPENDDRADDNSMKAEDAVVGGAVDGVDATNNAYATTTATTTNVAGDPESTTATTTAAAPPPTSPVPQQPVYTLGVSDHFFDVMEDRSGKDYRWIKPLQQPLSKVMLNDIERRKAVYVSDWTDGFKNMKKVIPAVLFLYFACLSPAISFGTIAAQITNDSIGVVEFLLSAGASGMAYSILCGQPMAFIAPTGLTLAFISGLFRFCTVNQLPFFPVYSWVGLWTSFFFTLLGIGGSSQLIRYCTRFTDEIFNALLSLNFVYEAVASLKRNFDNADPHNLTTPFVALAMALSTYTATLSVAAYDTSKFFNKRFRRFVKNFGPVIIFCAMTALNCFPSFDKFNIPTLSVPDTFQLAGGRKALIAINSIPNKVKLLCSLPAMLLTSLFFMDQNISVRVVNNPDNKLKKGPAYNLDMVALGLITGVLSVFGLPWMCGATVQSMNHVRAMTDSEYNPATEEVEIVDVTETRLTGFVVHALIACSLLFLPVIRLIPIPVVSGVFLFLGRKLMSGNSFLQRIRDTFIEKNRLLEDNPIRMMGRKRTALFTGIQIACLVGLWTFKQNPKTAIFFPSVIGMLIAIRSSVLPKMFTEEELVELGDPTPSKHLNDGVI
eukprot:CAMPEP_0113460486 /NCGR_PEP_ID=MMETSP0014_2-20120614/11014_1 /TAXON_ID=2857 /ORGANISM="Nitzschia sp." /LENGTH=730 /DNA_ID=CAMNT_0000352145 /DNA_START=412 /DNA_END=2604 /DNA_ORIENTATION=- /assembly_acc=CAM_ASM_000159